MGVGDGFGPCLFAVCLGIHVPGVHCDDDDSAVQTIRRGEHAAEAFDLAAIEPGVSVASTFDKQLAAPKLCEVVEVVA